MRAPGMKGAANLTPNQVPNSLESDKARQTRLSGARRRIFFSMRSGTVGSCTGSGIDYATSWLHIGTKPFDMQPQGCVMAKARASAFSWRAVRAKACASSMHSDVLFAVKL